MYDIPLVITSAVQPTLGVYKTDLQHADVRLREHLRGLTYWIFHTNVQRIVVCDSTDFDYRDVIPNFLLNVTNKDIELLRFRGNVEAVEKRGKGFGEGELMSYALANSRILRESEAFFKVTGKLWVTNLDRFRLAAQQLAYFYQPFRTPSIVDTRFYYIRKDIFQTLFEGAYRRVDDKRGVYLEHVYRRSIPDESRENFTSRFVPRLFGVSGSTGGFQDESTVRFELRRVAWSIRTRFSRGIK
jgi:hypothetical protein